MSNENVYLYYRTYAGISSKNLFAKTKEDLIEVCWRSLEIEKTEVKVFACIDVPTEPFKKFMFARTPHHFYTEEGADCYDSKNRLPLFGGGGSYFKLREFMSNNKHKDDDIVMILEDDYLFVPGGFQEWIDACRSFDGFVTPSDHPDRYTRKDDKFATKTKIKIFNKRHWRNVESTTGTVGGKYKYFRRSYFLTKTPRMYIFSFWPGRIFGKELTSMDRVFYRRIYRFLGIQLFAPMPALAVHLAEGNLDSVVDWEKRYIELKNETKQGTNPGQ